MTDRWKIGLEGLRQAANEMFPGYDLLVSKNQESLNIGRYPEKVIKPIRAKMTTLCRTATANQINNAARIVAQALGNHANGGAVHFSRSQSHYDEYAQAGKSKGYTWHNITVAVALLADAGLIITAKGSHQLHRESTLSLTQRAIDQFGEFIPMVCSSEPLKSAIIAEDMDSILITTTDTDGNKIRRAAARSKTGAMSDRLAWLNEFQGRFKWYLGDDTEPLKISAMRRIFCGSLKKGGRFFHTGKADRNPQQMSNRARSMLEVEDQDGNRYQTVEEDFPGCHPRLAYAVAGYRLTPSEAKRAYTIRGVNRALAKLAWNTMMNCHDVQEATLATRRELYTNDGLRNENRIAWDGVCPTTDTVIAALMHKHTKIAHLMFAGLGLELQKIDSEMADRIMTSMTRIHSCPILCVHDSFIVPVDYQEKLVEAMRSQMDQQITKLRRKAGWCPKKPDVVTTVQPDGSIMYRSRRCVESITTYSTPPTYSTLPSSTLGGTFSLNSYPYRQIYDDRSVGQFPKAVEPPPPDWTPEWMQ